MDDIAPSLLKLIQKDFQKDLNKSEVISELYAKVRDGTATYAQANQFAIEVGNILAEVYKNNLSSAVLPDGKMYYNIAQRILNPTMKNNYNLIVEVTNHVQQQLNEAAGIGIKPITPKLNQDRIDGIVNRVSDSDYFDDVAWILGEPIVNFSQSIVDDAIRENAEFHSKAGMSPLITREVAGNCCEWCRNLAGKYRYPDEVPDEVYHRHQRCRCTVDYDPRSEKIQNVHNKQWKRKEIVVDIDRMGQAKIYEADFGTKKYAIRTYKNDNYENIWCQTYSNDSQRMCEYLNDTINNKYPGVEQTVIAKKSTLQGIAAYDHSKKTFFICEELADDKKFNIIVDGNYFAAKNLDDVLVHELGGHKRHWEAVYRYYNDNADRFKSIQDAKQELESNLRKYITEQISNDSLYLAKNISDNAFEQFAIKKVLNECIADAIILIEKNELKDEYLKRLVEGVIFYDGNAK